MFVELVLRAPDDDVDFEVKFLKRFVNLETALCFQRGRFVSDRRSEIVSVLSELF